MEPIATQMRHALELTVRTRVCATQVLTELDKFAQVNTDVTHQ